VAYTISAPAVSLPQPGQFFVESATFCDGTGGDAAKDAAALLSLTPAAIGGGGRRLRRVLAPAAAGPVASKQEDAAAAADAPAAADAALESWASVDDNFVQSLVDGRWYVQSQTRLNNTDAASGRCNVQFTVRGACFVSICSNPAASYH
jgi:hypothetical protein